MDPKFGFGAGLKDTKVRDAAGVVHDLYGVTSAEGAVQREETEVRGDDQILGSFGSALREEITLEANAVSFDVLQAVTGNQLTETANSARILLGTTKELNPTFVEVQAFTNAKFKDGTAAEIKKTWFKVQINTISFSQAGEQEFNATLEGVALQTDVDITGAAIDGLPDGELTVAAVEIYNPNPVTPPVAPAAWAATTEYSLGDKVTIDEGVVVMTVTTAGTSGSTEPAAPGAGNTVVDGTVTWTQDS